MDEKDLELLDIHIKYFKNVLVNNGVYQNYSTLNVSTILMGPQTVYSSSNPINIDAHITIFATNLLWIRYESNNNNNANNAVYK